MIYEFMAIFGQQVFQAGAEILFFGHEEHYRVGGFAWFRWLKCITWSHATARCTHETIDTIRLENETLDQLSGVTLGTHIGLPFLDLSNKHKAANYWLYVNHEITRMRGAKYMPLQELVDFFDEIWSDFYCFEHPFPQLSNWKLGSWLSRLSVDDFLMNRPCIQSISQKCILDFSAMSLSLSFGKRVVLLSTLDWWNVSFVDLESMNQVSYHCHQTLCLSIFLFAGCLTTPILNSFCFFLFRFRIVYISILISLYILNQESFLFSWNIIIIFSSMHYSFLYLLGCHLQNNVV